MDEALLVALKDNPMRIDCTNLINGEWIPTSETLDNRCPANTDEVLGTAPNSGEAEAYAAIEAAKAAREDWWRACRAQTKAVAKAVGAGAGGGAALALPGAAVGG